MSYIETIDDMDVAQLEREIITHNYHYWVRAQPVISDYVYDSLVERLKAVKPDSLVVEAVGTGGAMDAPELRARIADVIAEYPPPAELEQGEKIAHDSPMLSLDKCYDEETLRKWFAKFDGDVMVSPKIDGVAASMKYRGGELVLAVTRGNGVRGELMTENARQIIDLPKAIDAGAIEVRGEAYMPLSVFRKDYAEQYANPRNLTAGALKQKDVEVTAAYRIHFFAYDLIGEEYATEQEKVARLRELGFQTVDSVLVSEGDLQRAYDDVLAKRDDYDYETDGVVYKTNAIDEQRRMGWTAHHPRYAIAYKFQGDSGTTTLVDVEWSISRTGAINPVAIVEPVELSGATVTRISLHNLSIMAGLGKDGVLYKNSQVVAMRRGGVIPNLEHVARHGDVPFEVPEACPTCGAPTYSAADVLMADHALDCRDYRLKRLEHFISVVKVDGFGVKILGQLFDHGLVRTPPDFFRLTPDQLLPLERMGETLANKLVGNLQRARTMPADVFLRALGVNELGKHVSAILAETCKDLDAVLALSAEELANIHTIGDVIAQSVVAGLAEQRELIEQLLEVVELTWPSDAPATPRIDNSPLAGRSVLFTGAMASMNRKDAQNLVKDCGGEVSSGVSSKLNLLVLGDKDVPRYEEGWRSSKLKKAEKLIGDGADLRIISESEFLTMAKPE